MKQEPEPCVADRGALVHAPKLVLWWGVRAAFSCWQAAAAGHLKAGACRTVYEAVLIYLGVYVTKSALQHAVTRMRAASAEQLASSCMWCRHAGSDSACCADHYSPHGLPEGYGSTCTTQAPVCHPSHTKVALSSTLLGMLLVYFVLWVRLCLLLPVGAAGLPLVCRQPACPGVLHCARPSPPALQKLPEVCAQPAAVPCQDVPVSRVDVEVACRTRFLQLSLRVQKRSRAYW